MSDYYAVIGNPVEHSLSPRIHALFAAQTGQDIEYGKLFAAPDAFVVETTAFFENGGKGMNVTLPFKQQACVFADKLTPRADAAQAVNTLIRHPDGQCEGDNTDGAGLVRDLVQNHGLALNELRILLLGAGGAVRGVLAPLMEQRPVSLTVANRTIEKAAELSVQFAEHGRFRGTGLAEAGDFGPYDLIINGTSAGVDKANPDLPENLFAPDGSAYDMFYASEATPFVRWARAQGAQAWDGFGMLVEQAAESFRLWRGEQPDTAAVIRELRP